MIIYNSKAISKVKFIIFYLLKIESNEGFNYNCLKRVNYYYLLNYFIYFNKVVFIN